VGRYCATDSAAAGKLIKGKKRLVTPVAGSTDSLLRVPAAEGSAPGWQR
jgi:hypothetical protein